MKLKEMIQKRDEALDRYLSASAVVLARKKDEKDEDYEKRKAAYDTKVSNLKDNVSLWNDMISKERERIRENIKLWSGIGISLTIPLIGAIFTESLKQNDKEGLIDPMDKEKKGFLSWTVKNKW